MKLFLMGNGKREKVEEQMAIDFGNGSYVPKLR